MESKEIKCAEARQKLIEAAKLSRFDSNLDWLLHRTYPSEKSEEKET